ncbi:tetratricopeptide repeat protein [Geothermobacter ehrlichii]|uniref:tetratricopeptide repeat protein n=1 Tax=Geothermobacter ehrlichii TaxID=213224 RepID=UPI0016530DAF|nr:tetratricopeptide repeat protein [Geothermobacter ehrlichii]
MAGTPANPAGRGLRLPDPESLAFYHYTRARLLANDGQLQEAEAALLSALDFDPRSSQLRLYLGQLRLQMDDPKGAARAVEEALIEAPDFLDGHLFLGGLYFNLRDYRLAAAHFAEAARIAPEREAVWLHLGLSYFRLGEHDKAVEVFKNFLDKKPDSAAGLVQLARSYRAAERFDEAETAYQHLIDLQPDHPVGYLELGEMLIEQGNFAAAERVFRLGVDRVGQPNLLRHRLVGILVRQQRPDEALDLLDVLLRDNPDDLEAKRKTGLLLLEKGDWSRAARAFRQVLERRPDLDRVRYFLGLAQERGGRWQEALATFELISDTSELHPDAVFHRAFVLQQMERFEQAVALLLELIDSGHGRSDVYDYLAALYDRLGQKEKALQTLEKGYGLYPDAIDLLYRQGVVLERNGEHEAAVDIMRQVLVRDPDHPEALNHVAYSYAEADKNLDVALEMVQKALKRKQAPHIYDTLGWVYYRLGRLTEARSALEKAISGLPQDAIVWDHLATVYAELGESAMAAEAWKKSLELKPDQPGIADKLNRLEKAGRR